MFQPLRTSVAISHGHFEPLAIVLNSSLGLGNISTYMGSYLIKSGSKTWSLVDFPCAISIAAIFFTNLKELGKNSELPSLTF